MVFYASKKNVWYKIFYHHHYYDVEDWELDFEWLRVRHIVKDSLKQETLPDLNLVLLMIGIQELGFWKKAWTKEEKQDLMHIAICRLLSYEGYYAFEGLDTEGWPHYRLVAKPTFRGEKEQEIYLKEKIVQYFKQMDTEAADYQ
jgi:hypothetical protein